MVQCIFYVSFNRFDSSDQQSTEQMDISEESSNSSQENMHECQVSEVLRLANPINADILNNEILDNKKFSDSTTGTTSIEATNFHPLMISPRSPDYPDLIPEKPKSNKQHINFEMHFNPQANSTELETESNEFLDRALPLNYSEQLPDIPDSPTAMKKLRLYDFPVEVPDVTSDNENDKSVYEAHLSPNFQNVSLKMNEKEGKNMELVLFQMQKFIFKVI